MSGICVLNVDFFLSFYDESGEWDVRYLCVKCRLFPQFLWCSDCTSIL